MDWGKTGIYPPRPSWDSICPPEKGTRGDRRELGEEIKVSIIIPTIKPESELRNLITDIHRTVYYPLDLIVVSGDRSVACNTNIGLDKARGEFIIICGDDIEQLPDEWDKKLVDAMEVTGASMVGPRLLNPDQSLQATNYNNFNLQSDYVQVSTMITACSIFRSSKLHMDEGYKGSGYDDTDFCNQLGGTFFVANTVRMVHRNEKKNQFNEYNRTYFNKKWGLNGIHGSTT